ncbi:MAG: hypothetical protein RSC52_05685, partial [Oscillospiraceae bacterium]
MGQGVPSWHNPLNVCPHRAFSYAAEGKLSAVAHVKVYLRPGGEVGLAAGGRLNGGEGVPPVTGQKYTA